MKYSVIRWKDILNGKQRSRIGIDFHAQSKYDLLCTFDQDHSANGLSSKTKIVSISAEYLHAIFSEDSNTTTFTACHPVIWGVEI